LFNLVMNKKEAEELIDKFFRGKHSKEEVGKIKNLAMSYQIKLGNKRKLFCNRCYSMNLQVKGIKNNIKRVECKDCMHIFRWKVN